MSEEAWILREGVDLMRCCGRKGCGCLVDNGRYDLVRFISIRVGPKEKECCCDLVGLKVSANALSGCAHLLFDRIDDFLQMLSQDMAFGDCRGSIHDLVLICKFGENTDCQLLTSLQAVTDAL